MRLHRNERKRESRKRRGKCFKKNVAVQFEMKKQKKKKNKKRHSLGLDKRSGKKKRQNGMCVLAYFTTEVAACLKHVSL